MKEYYVCYVENKNWLASEKGGITDLSLFNNRENVLNWTEERLQEAQADNYIINGTTIVEEEIIRDSFYITLYKEYQNNWDYSFVINVRRMLIG